MKPPTKQEKLDHYATREIKRFYQIDGFAEMWRDTVIGHDDEGDTLCGGGETYELMSGVSEVRVLIREGTSPETAARLLEKVRRSIGEGLLRQIDAPPRFAEVGPFAGDDSFPFGPDGPSEDSYQPMKETPLPF